MNQVDIKLPVTCGQIQIILYLSLVISSSFATLSWYVWYDSTITSLGILGLFFSVIFGGSWWLIKISDGEKTFPFKFSCKCEEE